jgi:hypothetical protein
MRLSAPSLSQAGMEYPDAAGNPGVMTANKSTGVLYLPRRHLEGRAAHQPAYAALRSLRPPAIRWPGSRQLKIAVNVTARCYSSEKAQPPYLPSCLLRSTPMLIRVGIDNLGHIGAGDMKEI